LVRTIQNFCIVRLKKTARSRGLFGINSSGFD